MKNKMCNHSQFKIIDVFHNLTLDEQQPGTYTGAAFGQVQCLICNKTFQYMIPNGLVILDDEKYAKTTM